MNVISCAVPLMVKDQIMLGHGSGGKLSAELMKEIFLPAFSNPVLDRMDDQAIVTVNGARLAVTTDSFVVKPLFFRGGDIGSLAVHGTVNDLAMGGARPLYLTVAFILEEGLRVEALGRGVASLGRAAAEAGVQVIAGDTKVVEKGSGDELFINTTGIGMVPEGVQLSANQAKPGDCVILSGSIGEHGIAILAERKGIEFEGAVESDSAALHTLVADMLAADLLAADKLAAPRGIRCLRDPTRGGVSSTLNEIAQQSAVGIRIDERAITVRPEVQGACEMLGFDPLYVANEGKLIAIVDPATAQAVVDAMRRHPLGAGAGIIGSVTEGRAGTVMMRTVLGTTRVVDMLSGHQLPRIC